MRMRVADNAFSLILGTLNCDLLSKFKVQVNVNDLWAHFAYYFKVSHILPCI